MRYAQIDKNNICIADSFLSGEVKKENMIPLTENESSPLQKKYVNGRWEEVEKISMPYVESNTEIMMQAIADIELSNLEAAQERQLLAQQLADLELSIYERGN